MKKINKRNALILTAPLLLIIIIGLGYFIPLEKSSATDPSGCPGNDDRIYKYRAMNGEKSAYERAKNNGNFSEPNLICGVSNDPLAHTSTHYYELYI